MYLKTIKKKIKMKKFIFRSLLLSLIAISVFSCKKTEPKQNVNQINKIESADMYEIPKSGFDGEFQLGNEGRFLVFNNENGYLHAINNPSVQVRQNLYTRMNNLNHYSWKNYVDDNPNQGLDSLIKDEYFASILSAERTVQIGQNIYKIDVENEKVYSIHVKDKKHYNELINNNMNSPFIRVFSFNEDVLDAIKNIGGDPTPPALFCSESGIGGYDKTTSLCCVDSYCQYSFQGIAHFNRYGIYFSLNFECKRLSGDGLYMQIDMEKVYYKQRCGNSVGPYTITGYGGNSATFRYQSYSGSKNLNEVWFKGRVRGQKTINGQTLYVSSSWAEIRVNI